MDHPEAEWPRKAKRMLRVEMTRYGVTYDELAGRLNRIGVTETAANLRNKVSRGKFTAAFLLQCLEAMGCEQLNLSTGHGEGIQ
jgi:hypothetical protein